MKLREHVAVITGGGGAIGRAVALRLAAEGAAIAAFDVRLEEAEETARAVIDRGGQAAAFALDIRETAQIERAIAAVEARWGRIDILVNSAGGSARGQSAELLRAEEAVIDRILGVNLHGVIYMARAVLGPMTRRRSGRIVNIGSIVGMHGKARLLDYAAAKGGVIALTKTLAMEVGEHGITVNCVSPGIVPRDGEGQDPERVRRTNFLGRVGKAEDIAHAVAFLVSDEADFITGHNLVVDGGRSLGLKEH
ncbi:SDR family oxidoreductase [Paenibacillus sp. IB182496]|uniref:SDR family oxidoreductase n=1 Tax=Paenibacillus sabuli TaxID=2772509 RepID=A0A927BT50_9BACL|nr:SDR family NAD(P)-dependent oxidoreductase [Paenibacillus sabuli]MBD2846311.1 SDR family oxidoreductase [Paenibacillus sabuli]